MIVKIFKSNTSDFPGVKYNDKKVKKGDGELIGMNNFPSHINQDSSAEVVRDYFKSVSSVNKTKNKQFHAMISTRFREHSKEELKELAHSWMKEMGYENQPYILVFHNDTDNNHVHIVSTRVNVENGKKMNDSFEKLKSQRNLAKVMREKFGEEEKLADKVQELLAYKFSNENQMRLVFSRAGFDLVDNENKFSFSKGGVMISEINKDDLKYSEITDDNRIKQIREIFKKYQEKLNTQVFQMEELKNPLYKEPEKGGGEFVSEFQSEMKRMFGIDIVFHSSGNKTPFGFSVIDNFTGQVFKGSEIAKMKTLFSFTDDKIDKRLFDKLNDFNIYSDEHKKILLHFYQGRNPELKDFMVFKNRNRKSKAVFNLVKQEGKAVLEGKTTKVNFMKGTEGKIWVFSEEQNFIGEADKMFSEKELKELDKSSLEKLMDNIYDYLKNIKTIRTGKGNDYDPYENRLAKKKKKKRR